MAENLNTWLDHLARQNGAASYRFNITLPGEYIVEIREAGLSIVKLGWRPTDEPVLTVELDNQS